MIRGGMSSVAVVALLAPAVVAGEKVAPPRGVRFIISSEPAGKEHRGALQFSPDGRMVLVHTDKAWTLYDPVNGTEVRHLKVSDDCLFKGWSRDGKFLAVSEVSGSKAWLRLIEASTGKEVWRVAEWLGDEDVVTFTADNRSVALLKRGQMVQLDLATGKELRKYGPKLHGVKAFSQDLRRACSFQQERAAVWDTESGKMLWEAALTTERVNHTYHSECQFTLDRSRVIVSVVWNGALEPGRDQTFIFDAASGKKLGSYSLGGYLTVAPNGRYLMVGGDLGVELVDLFQGKVRATFEDAISPHYHPRAIFSADGRLMAYRSSENVVRLLETATGGVIDTYKRPELVQRVAFASDGRTLAVSYADGEVHFHDLTGLGKDTAETERKQADIESQWADLGGDAFQAQRALWQLARSPKQALPLIRRQVVSPSRPNATEVTRLIAELDDEKFKVRDSAQKKLAALGPSAAPALTEALEKSPSLELRRRLEKLLAELRAVPERNCRSVAVLEAVANDEAVALLKELARGHGGDPLTLEARAALKRLEEAQSHRRGRVRKRT